MNWDKTSTALSVDSHVLEGDDRLIGVCWPTEKNRVFFVAEVRATGGINTDSIKPLEQRVEVSCGMTFERNYDSHDEVNSMTMSSLGQMAFCNAITCWGVFFW